MQINIEKLAFETYTKMACCNIACLNVPDPTTNPTKYVNSIHYTMW